MTLRRTKLKSVRAEPKLPEYTVDYLRAYPANPAAQLKLAEAISFLRKRNAYCLDPGSRRPGWCAPTENEP